MLESADANIAHPTAGKMMRDDRIEIHLLSDFAQRNQNRRGMAQRIAQEALRQLIGQKIHQRTFAGSQIAQDDQYVRPRIAQPSAQKFQRRQIIVADIFGDFGANKPVFPFPAFGAVTVVIGDQPGGIIFQRNQFAHQLRVGDAIHSGAFQCRARVSGKTLRRNCHPS